MSYSAPNAKSSNEAMDNDQTTSDQKILTRLGFELRTPLNHIKGYTELLSESANKAPEHAALRRNLRSLQSAGEEIVVYLGYALVQWKIDLGQVVLAEFREQMHGILANLSDHLETCEACAQKLDSSITLSDLSKIRQATSNFCTILDHDQFDTFESWTTPPISRIQVSPPRNGNPSAPATSKAYRKLLIVDDQEMNREFLQRLLKRMHYEVTTVENGQEALDIMTTQSFDLVLLDIMMPIMDGFETLNRIKSDSVLKDIPVIMLTAVDDPKSTVRCIEAGAEDFISKPHNPVILQARINASLERKRLRDVEHAHLDEIQNERAKTERLLLNILPKPISQRLKQGEQIIVDHIQESTVLFADIVGFTQFAVKNSPVKTVNLLNEIFSSFDELSLETGVEKIKTIGDAYMVVAGVPLPQKDHAQRVARTALGIIEKLGEFNRRHGYNWQVRIGIHSGPLVAGIIGSNKFSYDLWGDTVNVASRLESHAETGSIFVSDETAELLEPHCDLTPRGKIDLKNRGVMNVHQLISFK